MDGMRFELAVRGLTMPSHCDLPAELRVGPCNLPDRQILCLEISAAEAHLLHHELGCEETLRSQVVVLMNRVVSAAGARVAGARLIAAAPDVFAAAIQIVVGDRLIEVPAEPAHAIAVAVRLGVPLVAEAALFPPCRCEEAAPLSRAIADLLDALERDPTATDDASAPWNGSSGPD